MLGCGIRAGRGVRLRTETTAGLVGLSVLLAACGAPRGAAADAARRHAWSEQSEIVNLLEERPYLAGQERLVEVRQVLAEPQNSHTGEMRAPESDDEGRLHFWMFYGGAATKGGGLTRPAWSLLCVEFVLDAEGPTELDLKDAGCEGTALDVDDRYLEVNLD